VIEHQFGGKFREVAIVVRPKKHCYLAWWGFVTFRSIHNRRIAYIMWRGKTKWIRRA
jgi:hypothetical protein